MPLSPVIVPPRAQASRRCETQAPLSGKPPSCAKRFGPLTPSARSGNLIVSDGTKNGLPAPNKELAINRKQPLDRKSPIQVRIRLPPAASQERTVARTNERALKPGTWPVWLGEAPTDVAQLEVLSRLIAPLRTPLTTEALRRGDQRTVSLGG